MVIQERRGLIRASNLTAELLRTESLRQRHQKQCYFLVAVVRAANTEAHLQLAAGCRLTKEAEAEDGGTEPHKSNPLTQRVTCMETNGCIPSSERQRFSFSCSANVTGAVAFLAQTRHGITRVAPARAEADVAAKAPVTLTHLPSPVHTGRNMNEWLQANNEYKQLTLG